MSGVLDVVSAVAAPAGILFGVVGTNWYKRRIDKATVTKIDADAAHVIANTAVLLVAPLQQQLTDLTGRVKLLETENVDLKTKFQAALEFIRELRIFIHNHVPDKTPPSAPSSLEL